jgi:GNAT superfamily N-acetyltransferase
MNRMETMAEAQGANAFVITLALENRMGVAWAEWRGYLRDGEAPTYLLCSGNLPAGGSGGAASGASYRPGTSSDVEALIGLSSALYPAGFMSASDWAAVLPEVTVAEKAGEVAGFLWLRGPTGRIKLMSVAAGARRQGIGRGLLQQAIQTAQSRGLQRVEAKVRQENDAMLALLRQAGFNRTLPVSTWVKRPG